MGVGMFLYAQLVQTTNKQCKSAIILQCYHPHLSDFCSRPRLTEPNNHIIISLCCQNLSSFLLKVSVVSADITISGTGKSLYSKILFSYGYGRSLQMPPFDRLYTSFYCSAIVNIAICCTVLELLTLSNHDLEIWLIVTEDRSNWYYSKVLVRFPFRLL